MPRFAFEKFQGTDDTLSTRMKAVGEVMAIGRTFDEAFGKAMRSLEDGRAGLGDVKVATSRHRSDEATSRRVRARPRIASSCRRGAAPRVERRARLTSVTRIDPCFMTRIADMVAVRAVCAALRL